MEKEVVWVNGKLLSRGEASVSVFDHGFLYGDGVFEGIKIADKRLLLFEEHLDRLYHSLKVFGIKEPMPRQDFRQVVLDACKASQIVNGYVRPVVSRGPGDLGVNPNKCKEPTVVVIISRIQLYPKEFYERGLDVVVAKTRKTPKECMDGSAKICNYANNTFAIMEANKAGAQESIMLLSDGRVSEASADNIFIVRNGEVWTPTLSTNCLPGITRAAVLRIAKEIGITALEKDFGVKELTGADEVFLTGTGAGIVPVATIGGKKVGNGARQVTNKLMETYFARVPQMSTPYE
ncbi:branched-chain-amino-acid transaminase [Candidatus Micrarchaeota archaeon]|nr:branched-chain-amino-acid transaminase [Candidatus Micrarchaeota archaeon]